MQSFLKSFLQSFLLNICIIVVIIFIAINNKGKKMRLTIKEYVDILYPHHMKKSEIALKIGATIKQLNYAENNNRMKLEIKQKLVRLAVKYK